MSAGAALLQRLQHWAGNRVGDAEPAAKVFKGVAERVERRDHSVTCVDNRIHVGPFSDDAESTYACREFSQKIRSEKQSPIRITSIALPKSMSFPWRDELPHVFT